MTKQKTYESTSQAYSVKSGEDDTDSDTDNDSATVEEYNPESVKTTPTPDRHCQKMTITIPSHAKAFDRVGVSDRSAAILATSVLHDLGVASPIDRCKVIDRSQKSTENAAKHVRNSSRMRTVNLKVEGCDGANMNTGRIAGVFGRLEETFRHPL